MGPLEGRTHSELPSRRLCQWCQGWSRRGPVRRSDRGLGTSQRRFPRVLGPLLEVKVVAAQACPTLCDPTDRSPPGPSAHGIRQARPGSGLPRRSPGDVPDSGINPSLLHGLLRCRRIPPNLSRWGSAGGSGCVRSCQSRSCRPRPPHPFPKPTPGSPQPIPSSGMEGGFVRKKERGFPFILPWGKFCV